MPESDVDNNFGSPLGAAALGTIGSQSNVFYRNDGTIQALSANATRYKIGVRATTATTQNLNTLITLTITGN